MGSWCSNTATVRTEEDPINEDKLVLGERDEVGGDKDINKNVQSVYSPLPTLPLPSLTETDSKLKFSLKLYQVQND